MLPQISRTQLKDNSGWRYTQTDAVKNKLVKNAAEAKVTKMGEPLPKRPRSTICTGANTHQAGCDEGTEIVNTHDVEQRLPRRLNFHQEGRISFMLACREG